jgi:hypothetical protein
MNPEAQIASVNGSEEFEIELGPLIAIADKEKGPPTPQLNIDRANHIAQTSSVSLRLRTHI